MQSLLGEVVDNKMRLNSAGEIVKACWEQLSHHYPHVQLDAFVVMPNHVHGIIILTDYDMPGAGLRPAPTKRHELSEIVRAFKSFSSRRINELRNTPGVEIWQRNYYDHIIRNEKSLSLIRLYIRTNPLMWIHDPDNPIITKPVKTLDRVLMEGYGFDKEELEFVRNYIEYRKERGRI